MTVPILEVRDLRKEFVIKRSLLGRPLTRLRAVDNVSLALAPGETLAIVGESGCGKSTLGRLMLNLISSTEGQVLINGEDVTHAGSEKMRSLRHVSQLVFQDPFASLNPSLTVGRMLMEPLMLHNIVPPAQRRARMAELLTMVGLRPEHAERYPRAFSGGQRQRIAIARALASEPSAIVCDEAVSALDVSVQAQILNLLFKLRDQLGLALVFISHDLSVVRHISDRVAVMYLGRVVEQGPTEELFANPRHPYTRALIAAIPVPDPSIRASGADALHGDLPSPIAPPPGCRLHTRCPMARSECSTHDMRLEETGDGHLSACLFWRDLPTPAAVAEEKSRDPRLERQFAAFAAGTPQGASA